MKKRKENTPYGDIFLEIEQGLWEHNFMVDDGSAEPYTYSDEHFRACLKIFIESLLWKMWERNEEKNIEEKAAFASKMGYALRELIIKFTGIDSHDLHKKPVGR